MMTKGHAKHEASVHKVHHFKDTADQLLKITCFFTKQFVWLLQILKKVGHLDSMFLCSFFIIESLAEKSKCCEVIPFNREHLGQEWEKNKHSLFKGTVSRDVFSPQLFSLH